MPRRQPKRAQGDRLLTRRGTLALILALQAPADVRAAAMVVDARGRNVPVGDLSRIVCIGGAITEIVYALGASEQVVAVDSTSQYPSSALHDKHNVGYMRLLSAEGVLAVDPSLLLVIQDAGPPEAIDVLLAGRVPLLFVDGTPTPQAVVGRVRFVADVLGRKAGGEALCRSIEAGFTSLAAWRTAHPIGQRVLFVLSMVDDRLVVGGSGTAADAIIKLAGGINAAGTLQGYKSVGEESLAFFEPDVVLAMDHAGPALGERALELQGFRLTKAGARRNLIRMDGELLLGFGPRTPEAALELARRLADAAGPT